MNIFYALSEGRGRLTETNLSAFVAFLLEPHKPHGLSDVFLRAFLSEVAKSCGEPGRFDDVLSSPLLAVQVGLEKRYGDRDSRTVDIDIQIMTGEGEGQRKAHHLIVENKVKASSAQRTQLADEFACVSAAISEADPAPITVVFLTPPGESGALRDEFGTLELDGRDAHRKAWMRWRAPAAEHQQTIVDLIRELLRREAIAEIEPITDYIRHTLKAFVLFLQREIVSESAEKRRLPSLDATDATDQRIVELDSERYLIVRYGDETVKVFDVEEDQEVDAHPKLRRTNEAYGLDVPLTYASQRIKNTRVLGKQVLKALSERNLGIVPDVARGQSTA